VGVAVGASPKMLGSTMTWYSSWSVLKAHSETAGVVTRHSRRKTRTSPPGAAFPPGQLVRLFFGSLVPSLSRGFHRRYLMLTPRSARCVASASGRGRQTFQCFHLLGRGHRRDCGGCWQIECLFLQLVVRRFERLPPLGATVSRPRRLGSIGFA